MCAARAARKPGGVLSKIIITYFWREINGFSQKNA